jgi:hypothetical protein
MNLFATTAYEKAQIEYLSHRDDIQNKENKNGQNEASSATSSTVAFRELRLTGLESLESSISSMKAPSTAWLTPFFSFPFPLSALTFLLLFFFG